MRTALRCVKPRLRRRVPGCVKKKTLRLKPEGGRVSARGAEAYLAADLAPRLNFDVNFSTRPAVSTRRFSPV